VSAALRLTLVAVALLASTALAQACPTRTSWPTADWTSAPVDATAKAAAISALETYAFTLKLPDASREGIRTDGLLIIKNGKLVYEKYARGFDATKRHISWSAAKSISSALMGVAVKQGVARLSDSICKYLSGYSGKVCDITVGNVITFSSGLAWQEGYEHESYQTSSVISMFFGVGHRDHLKHILSHAIVAAPGAQWMYSTGDAELLAGLAKSALTSVAGKDAFWTLLFDKIGMSRTTLEEDERGTPNGGSHVFATPRDFAKFGYLFLNDGCWNGERLLPAGWVASSTTISAAFRASASADEDQPSGYMWWLNQPLPERSKPRPWADVPDDAYAAEGHWGQFIIVVPSEDVVIVRTGDDRNTGVSLNTLIKLSLEVAR
jgi:CubicO group peptidase (beta-lactamase class C family)